MPGDNAQAALREAQTFEDHRVVHAWDPKRQLGELFSKALRLGSTAWDVYCLYASGVTWEGSEPPEPTFWMHQLPVDSGADWRLLLNSTRLPQELLKLLGEDYEPARVNLGFLLHAKGIMTVTRDRSSYSLEDLQQAFDNLEK